MSLLLAKENDLHSIGFPLISAGIFGYPVDKAWRKAIEACNDFIQDNPDEKEISFISPLFIRPKYQNQGLGYIAIQKAFEMFPDVKIWRLDTIKQEARNCHLYEKCGFVRVGEEHVVNDKMALVDYEYRIKE